MLGIKTMIKKSLTIGILVLAIGVMNGCGVVFLGYSHLIGVKPDRQIKRQSKDIRNKEVLLNANYEGMQNGAHFKLRADNCFDLFWHSAFGWQYYAGTWSENKDSDTLTLSYLQDHKPFKSDQVVIQNKEIIFLDSLLTDSTPAEIRYRSFRIVENKMQ